MKHLSFCHTVERLIWLRSLYLALKCVKCEIILAHFGSRRYVVMVTLSGPFLLVSRQAKGKKINAKSHNNISESPVPPSATRPCSVERFHRPLSLRLKPKGNDIPIANIRNGTQPLHLLASRPQHTPFSWTLGRRDQGVDWFYPAWERIQAPNPSATFLTLRSHGTLHQRFACCNRPS